MKNKKSSSFAISQKQQDKLSNLSSSSGGSRMLVLKYLLAIDNKTRVNGLTAKSIGNGISEMFDIAIRDSVVRDFFRKEFNVGKESENSNYQAYNEKQINGENYFAIATQVQPMTYSLLTTQEEINSRLS